LRFHTARVESGLWNFAPEANIERQAVSRLQLRRDCHKIGAITKTIAAHSCGKPFTGQHNAFASVGILDIEPVRQSVNVRFASHGRGVMQPAQSHREITICLACLRLYSW